MADFKIVDKDIIPEMKQFRDRYNKRGVYLGFNNVNNLYTMLKGTCTDWTGFPGSGKTQVLMELLLNTSKLYGWKHTVYFPDVGNRWEILSDLIHKYTGKSFNENHSNYITDSEIKEASKFILAHFNILYKHNVRGKITPYEFWDMAVQHKIDTCAIDSWKDMKHDDRGYKRSDQYLEDVLSYRNQIAEDNGIHIHTIIHPKLTEKEDGKRKPPTPFDLKGGSEWFNNGKNQITVHRDDKSANNASFITHKIKPRAGGQLGSCELHFDLHNFVYYELNDLDGGQRRYAQAEGVNELTRPPALDLNEHTNLDFDNEKIPF